MPYAYSRSYVYFFWQIFQALRLFPALRLFQTLEYLKFNKLEQFEFRIQSGKNNWCLYTYRKIWKICFLTFCNIHYTILSTAFSTLLLCTFTYKNYKASKITFLQRLYVLFYFSLFNALKVFLYICTSTYLVLTCGVTIR